MRATPRGVALSHSWGRDRGGGALRVQCDTTNPRSTSMEELPKDRAREGNASGEALRRSEERSRALTEAGGTAVWSWDPVTQEGDFAATQRWWCALTGQTSEEQDGESGLGWIEAIHPEDREKARAAWTTAMESGTPYHVE